MFASVRIIVVSIWRKFNFRPIFILHCFSGNTHFTQNRRRNREKKRKMRMRI